MKKWVALFCLLSSQISFAGGRCSSLPVVPFVSDEDLAQTDSPVHHYTLADLERDVPRFLNDALYDLEHSDDDLPASPSQVCSCSDSDHDSECERVDARIYPVPLPVAHPVIRNEPLTIQDLTDPRSIPERVEEIRPSRSSHPRHPNHGLRIVIESEEQQALDDDTGMYTPIRIPSVISVDDMGLGRVLPTVRTPVQRPRRIPTFYEGVNGDDTLVLVRPRTARGRNLLPEFNAAAILDLVGHVAQSFQN